MSSPYPQRQSGLSLVELMIAMALSLLLMLGVIQIFLSSKQTYSTNSALSRVQESGRFAMEFLAQDIRNTGYKGQCQGELQSSITDDLKQLTDPIKGWDNISSWPSDLPSLTSHSHADDTDVILLKFAAGPNPNLAVTSSDDDTVSLSGASGIPKGTVTLISNVHNCTLFINTSNSSNSVAKNEGAAWSYKPIDPIEILPLQNTIYYIKDNSGDGRPNSLARQRLSMTSGAPWIAEELVEGVQNMQILYGISTGSSSQVTAYKKADEIDASDWGNVVSIQIDLLVVSSDTNVVPEELNIKYDKNPDGTYNQALIENRRLAQVFSTTIGIRNRLP